MAQTKLTRRQWAGALAVAQQLAAATPAGAQDPAAPAAAEADLLGQARQAVVRNREALAKIKIDRALEPATRFEA